MKKFKIYTKREGQRFINDGYVVAENYEEAKKEFAKEIWEAHHQGIYGDNTVHEDDDSIKEIEGNTNWYEGPGFYDQNYEPAELVFSQSDLEKGVESFSHDVYTWTIDEGRI